MSYTKYLVLGLLALTCVGCSTAKKPETATNQTQSQAAATKPAVLPNQTATVVTPESQQTAPSAVSTTTTVTASVTPETPVASTTAFTVDETWQTYTNKSLSFEFQWPTKGRYAPEWSTEFRKADDASIQDGCVNDQANLSSKSTFKEFCHTYTTMQTDALERTDYFMIKNGKQYIVISFFKKLYPDEKYKANNSADYEAMLETIMSTFKYTDNAQ